MHRRALLVKPQNLKVPSGQASLKKEIPHEQKNRRMCGVCLSEAVAPPVIVLFVRLPAAPLILFLILILISSYSHCPSPPVLCDWSTAAAVAAAVG